MHGLNDFTGTRTVGVISKVDQAASDARSLAAVNALLSGQGPPSTMDIPWVALIGQSVSIAAAHSSSEDSLETAWKAEMETLKSILNGAPSAKLGRIALVETLAHQIRTRLKQRLPNILSGYVTTKEYCIAILTIGDILQYGCFIVLISIPDIRFFCFMVYKDSPIRSTDILVVVQIVVSTMQSLNTRMARLVM